MKHYIHAVEDCFKMAFQHRKTHNIGLKFISATIIDPFDFRLENKALLRIVRQCQQAMRILNVFRSATGSQCSVSHLYIV